MFTMKKNWKKVILGGLATLVVASMIAGCGADKSAVEDKKDANGVKVLKVGTNATFVPFEFKDDKTEQLTGFDIDVINEVAKRMHVNVEFKNVTFDALVPSLVSKTIDVAASGMTITKARSEKVAFSTPYYESGIAIMTKEGSPIKDVSSLKGKKVAVQMGTTSDDLARKAEAGDVKAFNHTSDALLELKNSGVDAALIDLPVAQHYVNIHPEDKLTVIAYPNTKEYYGFAINKNNEDLLKAVNQALLDMKKDGSLNQLYKKWFKVDMPADMPVVAEPK